MLGKVGLMHHVDGIDLCPTNPEWAQQDFIVLTWLYGFISEDILGIIMEPG